MLGLGILAVFVIAAAWLWLTTDDQRAMVFAYAMALAFLAWVIALLTGQGSSAHY